MPLQTFESRDQVPDAQRDAAIETKDGKFIVFADEDVSGLKNTVAATRAERDAAKKKASELEARIAELEEQHKAADAGLSKDKLDEIRKGAEAKFQPVVAELDRLKAELRAEKLMRVRVKLAGAVLDEEAAWKVVGDHFDLADDGTPIVKADPTTDLEAYISGTLKTKYPFLFRGTEAAGTGAGGSRGGTGGGGTAKPVTQWSSDERRAYIEQHGAEAHQKLLDAALVEAATRKTAA